MFRNDTKQICRLDRGLVFNPQDGYSMFFRNIGAELEGYEAKSSKDNNFKLTQM